jgi:hypothetical protein
MEMLPALRENSPSSKFLQVQESTIWSTSTCPWGLLLCSLIAQQCLVLATFSVTVLFIAKAAPRAAGESDDTVTT